MGVEPGGESLEFLKPHPAAAAGLRVGVGRMRGMGVGCPG